MLKFHTLTQTIYSIHFKDYLLLFDYCVRIYQYYYKRFPLCWIEKQGRFQDAQGGCPRVVVSTAAFHARVRGSVPGLGGLKETKNASSPSTCESQYCGEPP